MIKVCKFGGTSMADANAIKCIAKIIHGDKDRRYVVVSAPGKRFQSDEKITDMLYKCNAESVENGNCDEIFDKISDRYKTIAKDLELSIDIDKYLNEVKQNILALKSADYAASCGEYLGAVIVAGYLGFEFINAKEIVQFNANGTFNEELTNDVTARKLAAVKYAVIPGFYGSMPDGSIKTFSRGGSDITGAIIARAVEADVYENWTDVNGFMTADPRIVHSPVPIGELSYKELRELSYMGASVLHPESIFPVQYKGIPINIRNTFEPDHPGTMIKKTVENQTHVVTGIAGKKNFATILIEKSMMNSQVGFGRKVLSTLEKYDVSFEHTPSGIDTFCVVVSEKEIEGKIDMILDDLKKEVAPDHIELNHGISLIATVGHNMAFKIGTAARLFTALSEAKVNIKMIDQGSSELNIIVGVKNEDYEKAILAIYHEFVKDYLFN